MGKEKGQRGREDQCKTHVKGLRQTPSIMATERSSFHSRWFTTCVDSSTSTENTLHLSLFSIREFPEGWFYVGQNYSADQLTLST